MQRAELTEQIGKLNIKIAKANKELDELELKYKKKKLEIRKYKNESAGLQLELQELELENFQVILGNAMMIGEMFDESSIDRIYLHFSDPWPKKGHHKRRLTYGSFLEMYARILKPHGDLVFKTDNRPFFDDSLEYFANSAFKTDVVDYDYHRISRSEPMRNSCSISEVEK